MIVMRADIKDVFPLPTDGREREFVFIGGETGPAASSESVSAHLSSAHTVQASTNSSPSHTLPGSKLSLQPRKK